ncbi:hypothetical protein ACJX0J_013828, partial [Zea mays]
AKQYFWSLAKLNPLYSILTRQKLNILFTYKIGLSEFLHHGISPILVILLAAYFDSAFTLFIIDCREIFNYNFWSENIHAKLDMAIHLCDLQVAFREVTIS